MTRHIIVLLKSIYFSIKWRKLKVKLSIDSQIARYSNLEGYNKIGSKSIFSGNLGKYTYIGENSLVCGDVGRFCSISDNVKVLVGTHPARTFVSTHPVFFSLKKQCGITFAEKQEFEESLCFQPENQVGVCIGNDVWIGSDVIIIGGVKIGDGAIIAAGAVVTKSVSPYSIVGGNPAKHIRNRFSDEAIEYLMNLKWWNKPEEWIMSNAEHFKSIYELIEYSGEGQYAESN